MSDDRAVQAAAEALSNADGPAFVGSANRRFVAEVAVAAAREVIEAEVLARIQASEGWHSDSWGVDCIYRDAVDRAARGGTP